MDSSPDSTFVSITHFSVCNIEKLGGAWGRGYGILTILWLNHVDSHGVWMNNANWEWYWKVCVSLICPCKIGTMEHSWECHVTIAELTFVTVVLKATYTIGSCISILAWQKARGAWKGFGEMEWWNRTVEWTHPQTPPLFPLLIFQCATLKNWEEPGDEAMEYSL